MQIVARLSSAVFFGVLECIGAVVLRPFKRGRVNIFFEPSTRPAAIKMLGLGGGERERQIGIFPVNSSQHSITPRSEEPSR